MTNALLVYITCETKEQAEDIGRELLKKRLVACVNIIDYINSQYLWPPKKGTIEEAKESILLAKTLESKWVKIEKMVLKLHSYENPDIMAIRLAHVSKKYYDWLAGELT